MSLIRFAPLSACIASLLASSAGCGDDTLVLPDAMVGSDAAPDAQSDADVVRPEQRIPDPDASQKGPLPDATKPAVDPLCGQVCDAITALPCAETPRAECV